MASSRVRLSPSAQRDLAGIIDRTVERFGSRQAKVYTTTLTKGLAALRAGPDLRDSVSREEFGRRLRSLHVAGQRRRGRHIIFYREAPDHSIEIVRILHDAMQFAQHLP